MFVLLITFLSAVTLMFWRHHRRDDASPRRIGRRILMPKRGSVQLLLLSLRPSATLGWGLGVAAVVGLTAGMIELKETVPLLDDGGFAQHLRQGAWEKALSGQSTPAHWPWEDMSANMSLAPAGKVPRLGLSATMLSQAGATPQALTSASRHAAEEQSTGKAAKALGDVAISDVNIGDSITFTAADGATCIYRVSGRRVVDPHLADGEAQRSDAEASLFNCGPFELIMHAAQEAIKHGEPAAAPSPDSAQQKL